MHCRRRFRSCQRNDVVLSGRGGSVRRSLPPITHRYTDADSDCTLWDALLPEEAKRLPVELVKSTATWTTSGSWRRGGRCAPSALGGRRFRWRRCCGCRASSTATGWATRACAGRWPIRCRGGGLAAAAWTGRCRTRPPWSGWSPAPALRSSGSPTGAAVQAGRRPAAARAEAAGGYHRGGGRRRPPDRRRPAGEGRAQAGWAGPASQGAWCGHADRVPGPVPLGRAAAQADLPGLAAAGRAGACRGRPAHRPGRRHRPADAAAGRAGGPQRPPRPGRPARRRPPALPAGQARGDHHQCRSAAGQTRQRLAGNRVVGDRLASLADPDARPIRKGKPAKATEFGHTVLLAEEERGFTAAHPTNKGDPPDAAQLVPAVQQVMALTGRAPGTVTGDRGFGIAQTTKPPPSLASSAPDWPAPARRARPAWPGGRPARSGACATGGSGSRHGPASSSARLGCGARGYAAWTALNHPGSGGGSIAWKGRWSHGRHQQPHQQLRPGSSPVPAALPTRVA
jgi:hypothetical protein